MQCWFLLLRVRRRQEEFQIGDHLSDLMSITSRHSPLRRMVRRSSTRSGGSWPFRFGHRLREGQPRRARFSLAAAMWVGLVGRVWASACDRVIRDFGISGMCVYGYVVSNVYDSSVLCRSRTTYHQSASLSMFWPLTFGEGMVTNHSLSY